MTGILRFFAENELALCQLPLTCQINPWTEINPLWPQGDNAPKLGDVPLLALYFDGNAYTAANWRRFAFFGPPSCLPLAHPLCSDFPFLIRSAAPHFAFQLSGPAHSPSHNSNAALNTLFNALLAFGRPLKQYGCTFYLPLYADKDLSEQPFPVSNDFKIVAKTYGGTPQTSRNPESANAEEAQAYLYFQPPIRDFLFDTKKVDPPLKPIKEWTLQPSQAQEWLFQVEEDQQLLSARITNVVLYQYFNKLCVLAVSVKPDTVLPPEPVNGLPSYPGETQGFGWNDSWWRDLAFADDAAWTIIKTLQLGNWLRFTKLARLLFASFTEQEDEHKIAKMSLLTPAEKGKLAAESKNLKIEPIEDKLGYHPIMYFLKGYFGTELSCFDPTYHLFYDDRLFVNVAYGYAGGKFSEDDADRLFSLALYVDAASDTFSDLNGFAYDPVFTRELMTKSCNLRWRGLGTYAGFTHYANVHFGQGGFFCNEIAPKHVPDLYGRMLLMTLLYQASLRYYRDRLMLLTSRKADKISSENVQELRKEFMLFTNAYWFREVTSQIQGREVFTMQQQALELQRDYEFIKEEMERLDAYMQGQLNNELNESSHKLNRLIYGLTAISLWFSYTQIVFDTGILSQSKSWILKLGFFPERSITIARWLVPHVQGITIFVSAVAFFLIVSYLVKQVISWLSKRKAN